MKRCLRLLAIIFLATAAFTQSDEIVPNENLVAEGIPKIPRAVADSVSRYSEFRFAAFSSWNPNAREMLVETRFADTNQIHQVKFPGGARTQLTFFPDRVGDAVYQPVTGDSFCSPKMWAAANFFRFTVTTLPPAT